MKFTDATKPEEIRRKRRICSYSLSLIGYTSSSVSRPAQLQLPPLRYPGFPVEVGGVRASPRYNEVLTGPCLRHCMSDQDQQFRQLRQLPIDSKEVSEWHDACSPSTDACHMSIHERGLGEKT